jgi:hypothetical protein
MAAISTGRRNTLAVVSEQIEFPSKTGFAEGPLKNDLL